MSPAATGPLEELRAMGLDTVDGAFACGDGQDLVKGGLGHRRRTQLSLGDGRGGSRTVYLKRYGPEPLRWRLKRWWTYGPGKSPAAIEARAIAAARDAGLPTMEVLHWGQDAGGDGRSFIIVSSVPGDALSRCMGAFLRNHAGDAAPAQLAVALGGLAGRLHRCGYVHRDFYTAHIFLDQAAGASLHLIDLARMFRPKLRRFRWRVKDLAQLKYSLPPGFVETHWAALIDTYLWTLGGGAKDRPRLDLAVDAKARQIRARHDRRMKRHLMKAAMK